MSADAGYGAPAPAPATVEALLRQRLGDLLGGWRGAVEAAVPTLAFVGVWLWRGDLRAALVASAVCVLAAVVLRLAQRQTLRYALSSVLATAVAAAVSLRTGRAEDAFLPSILWNLAQSAGYLLSVLVRWPVLGFVVALADPRLAATAPGSARAGSAAADEIDLSVLTQWRRHPGTVRVCARLTLVLAALMGARAAIMLPLYLTGQVAALGVAKVLLGWPAYLAVVAVMAAMLVRGHTPLDDAPASRVAPSGAPAPRRHGDEPPA